MKESAENLKNEIEFLKASSSTPDNQLTLFNFQNDYMDQTFVQNQQGVVEAVVDETQLQQCNSSKMPYNYIACDESTQEESLPATFPVFQKILRDRQIQTNEDMKITQLILTSSSKKITKEKEIEQVRGDQPTALVCEEEIKDEELKT